MKKILPALLPFLFSNWAAAQNFQLFFETGKSEITAEHRQQLDRWLQNLAIGNPADWKIEIEGYADSTGRQATNQALSLRRGQSVAAWLHEKDFAEHQILILARGESAEKTAQATNRRVEIKFEKQLASVLSQTAGDKRFEKKDLPKKASTVKKSKPNSLVPSNLIKFKAEEGTIWQSEKTGLIVQVPANALVSKKGKPVQGAVELRVREYAGLADLLSFGLPMHFNAGGEQLAFNSAAMFEVEAFQKDEKLAVAPGQSLHLDLPEEQLLPDAGWFIFDKKSEAWKSATAWKPKVLDENRVATDNARRGLSRDSSTLKLRENEVRELMAAITFGYDLLTGKQPFPAYISNRWDDSFWEFSSKFDTLRKLQHFDRQSRVSLFPKDWKNKDGLIEDQKGFRTELDVFKNYKWKFRRHERVEQTLRYQRFSSFELKFSPANNLWQIKLAAAGWREKRLRAELLHRDGSPLSKAENEAIFAAYRQMKIERHAVQLAVFQQFKKLMDYARVFPNANGEGRLDYRVKQGAFRSRSNELRSCFNALVAAGVNTNFEKADKIYRMYRLIYGRLGIDPLSPQLMQVWQTMQTSLAINKFGLYNCDQIFRMGNDCQPVLAIFKNENGEEIEPQQTAFMDAQRKIFFTAPGASTIYKGRKTLLDVIVYDENGRIFVCQRKDFQNSLQSAGEPNLFFLTVREVTQKVKTPDDWKTVLEI